MAARLSTVVHPKGSPESLRDVRGFSVKCEWREWCMLCMGWSCRATGLPYSASACSASACSASAPPCSADASSVLQTCMHCGSFCGSESRNCIHHPRHVHCYSPLPLLYIKLFCSNILGSSLRTLPHLRSLYRAGQLGLCWQQHPGVLHPRRPAVHRPGARPAPQPKDQHPGGVSGAFACKCIVPHVLVFRPSPHPHMAACFALLWLTTML